MTSAVSLAFIGQPATVSSSRTVTTPAASTVTCSIMFSSSIGRPISGSLTVDSAVRMADSSTLGTASMVVTRTGPLVHCSAVARVLGSVPVVADPSRRSVARDGLGVGIAVGAYGVAFGAAGVAAHLSVLQTSLLSLLAFTGGTQFAVVGVIAGGGSVLSAVDRRVAARRAQHPVRDADGAGAAGSRPASVDRRRWERSTSPPPWPWPNPTRSCPGSGSGGPPAPSTSSGTRSPCSVRSARTRSATRSGSGWTRWCRPPSWPCSLRGLRNGRIERRIAVGAAAIALVLIPFTPPGVPVLASVAALALGSLPARPELVGRRGGTAGCEVREARRCRSDCGRGPG